jgi:hypothetical protein
MYQYSVGLAAFDYIPIALSATGLLYITNTITLWAQQWRYVALIGACLIIVGGLSKATWKMLVASQQVDIAWMNAALFFCLAPGMLILSSAIWGAVHQQGRLRQKIILLTAVSLAIISLLLSYHWPDQRYGKFYLLGLATIGNLALSIQLAIKALQTSKPLAAACFTFNLLAVFVMVGLARLPVQSESLQWIEEILNTFSQGAFAYAAFILYSATKTNTRENS